MPSFWQWLIVILALAVGLAGGWVLRGLRAAAAPALPIVEGDPVAGVTETSEPATATVDQERPEAVVDEVSTAAAVTDEPVSTEHDASPAADATALPGVDTDTAPATAEPEPARVEAPVVAEAEPTNRVVAEPTAQESTGVTAPATVPAPRAAADDEIPPAADAAATPVTVNGTAAAANGTTVASNGSATGEAADDFRRIQGIGPKMAAALQAAGIRTYQQLSELDEVALRETIKAAGLRATPALATWPQQAKLLAGAAADAERVFPVGAGEQA